jgi:tetratricopeptide (TPR) repeat protein
MSNKSNMKLYFNVVLLICVFVSFSLLSCIDSIKVYVNDGDRFIAENRWCEAITAYSAAIKISPESGDIYYKRGIAYRSSQSYDLAAADLTRAIELKPDFAKAFTARALIYSLKNEMDFAIADMDRALNLDRRLAAEVEPAMGLAYYRLGIAYGKQGMNIQAVAFLSKCINLEYRTAEAYIERSRIYTFNNWITSAIADLSKAIKLNPQSAIAYDLRGIAYGTNNEFSKALGDFDRAIAIDATLAEAYTHRGWVYYNLKKYQQAMHDLDLAIKLEPASAISYYYRGLVYKAEDMNDFAKANFEKAKELTSDPVLQYKIEQNLMTITTNSKQ